MIKKVIFQNKEILKIIFFSMLLSFFILSIEMISSVVLDGYNLRWSVREIFFICTFCVILICSYGVYFKLILCSSFLFIQFSSLLYYAYFGSFYGPAHVGLFFLEFNEISESVLGDLARLSPVIFVGIISFFFIIFFIYFVSKKIQGYVICNVVIMLVFFGLIFNSYTQKSSQKYEPDSESFLIKNGLYSVSYFFGHDLVDVITGNYSSNSYAEYKIKKITKSDNYHVIIIVGESINPLHMNLYGYTRNTTPNLSFYKNNNKIITRYGISSAVTTRVSLPMFLNSQREPDNIKHIRSKNGSLFKIAKDNGFQTAFISTQKMDGISSAISSTHIDTWVDHIDLKKSQLSYDYKLYDGIDYANLNWDKPIFMVLNTRTAHSPYCNSFPENECVFSKDIEESTSEYRLSSYDDAILYLDKILYGLFNNIEKRTKIPIVFIFTSDHGQKLGSNGQWGHNFLDIETSLVPFVVYLSGYDSSVVDSYMSKYDCVIPHYEISKMVVNLLGEDIFNDNENEKKYYVNGVDLNGRAGFLPYSLDSVRSGLNCK